jgi:hypothetical protein
MRYPVHRAQCASKRFENKVSELKYVSHDIQDGEKTYAIEYNLQGVDIMNLHRLGVQLDRSVFNYADQIDVALKYKAVDPLDAAATAKPAVLEHSLDRRSPDLLDSSWLPGGRCHPLERIPIRLFSMKLGDKNVVDLENLKVTFTLKEGAPQFQTNIGIRATYNASITTPSEYKPI